MKIAYVSNSRFPSERAHMVQIVHMCNAFSELGHSVTLLVTDRKTPITESPEKYYGAKFHFSVQRLSIPDIVERITKIPKILWAFLYTLQRFFFARKVIQHVSNAHYDCLYGRDEWILLFLGFFISKEKIVWESHEAKYNYAARQLLKKKVPCIVISEGIRDFYLKNGVPESQLLVAHDGIDDAFFGPIESKENARRRLGISSDMHIAMYIGGFEGWKGVKTFFEAAEGTRDMLFVAIGGKPDEIEKYKEMYPSVLFLGPRPYRELKDNQQAADVLVIPNTATTSTSAEYTSPLKLFAYMTSKKPIVASRIPSITRVLEEDIAHFFVPDDAEDLSRVLKQVITNTFVLERANSAYGKSIQYKWSERAKHIISFIQ